MPAELLASSDWQALQADWQALLALTEQPREDVLWDPLRVYIDRHLNTLQRLMLNHQLSPDAQLIIQDLVQARFDQALEHLNLQRQQRQPYLAESRSYRGPFSRHQAMGDLESQLRQLQGQLDLPQVPRMIRQHVLHDDNLELLERLTLLQPPEARPELWRRALPQIVLLSWTEVEAAPALEALITQLPEQNVPGLAERVLKSSRFVPAQCSAVRLLAKSLAPEPLRALLEPLLLYPQTPATLLQEILLVLPAPLDSSWGRALLSLLARPETDTDAGRVSFAQVRQLALRRLAEQSELASELLGIFQQARNWEARSRLQAIQTLALAGIMVGFEQVIALLQESARQDDLLLLQQAVETLVLQRDPAAIPFLLGVLNGQYRQETALERFRRAFVAERQDQYPFLLKALERLGQTVIQDPLTGRWKPKASS
ncbi:MAG: hypothetical protein CVV27_08870 [Candidatus Melainabacteria bacterium HGW-Melainabacteria-1]|nr:MAG: hypothetical protein CVV27_08870 [Candidatus Melainabacteria bacterium HGW-Melainabacteria-1]